MIRFRFNEEKAGQAAAYLVWRHGGEYDYLSTVKLLYLADRTALIEIGRPITGDRMVEMRLGPILSETMDRLNGTVTSKAWQQRLTVKDGKNRIHLVSDDEQFKALSDYDISVLDRVDDEHGDKTPQELIDLCHDTSKFPELERRTSGSHTIFPEKVLRRVRVPDAKVKQFRAHAQAVWRAHEGRVSSSS